LNLLDNKQDTKIQQNDIALLLSGSMP